MAGHRHTIQNANFVDFVTFHALLSWSSQQSNSFWLEFVCIFCSIVVVSEHKIFRSRLSSWSVSLHIFSSNTMMGMHLRTLYFPGSNLKYVTSSKSVKKCNRPFNEVIIVIYFQCQFWISFDYVSQSAALCSLTKKKKNTVQKNSHLQLSIGYYTLWHTDLAKILVQYIPHAYICNK